MNEKLFLEIASGVITIAVALVTGLLIPYLRTKIDSAKLKELDYYISMAVRCAEQLYTPDQWKEKKAYVTQYVTDVINNLLKLKLTPEEIDALIEGAVNQIKHDVVDTKPYAAEQQSVTTHYVDTIPIEELDIDD